MVDERPQIIVVAGVTGSGKSTFCECYKNSFLQSLPLMNLGEGIQSGESFALTSNLTNSSQFTILADAKKKGYKITGYYLFTGRTLSLERARLRSLVGREPFDEALFRKSYETSYKGLKELFAIVDLLFFIRNQKEFEFISAFDPSTTSRSVFLTALEQMKSGVDRLK